MRQLATLLGVVCLAVSVLAGCASMAPRHVSKPDADKVAESNLSRLTVATPNADHDVLAQLLNAQFALDHSDLDAAARAYAKASAVSEDPDVAKRAAQLAVATHDSAAAEKAIARWAALGGHGVELAQVRARLALDNGNTDAARQQLLALVHSGDENAWRLFGQALMGARDVAQAGQLLRDIATPRQLPADSAAWLAMGQLGAKLGQVDYARTLAKATVDRFGCADCYAWAAQLQYQAGHHDIARTLYAKAVAKAPENKQLRMGYAALLSQGGDNIAAAHALAVGKQDAATYQLRAAYAARAHDNAELKRIYGQLKSAPDDVRADSNYLLGQLAEILGHAHAALDWFAQVPEDDEHRFDADLHSALLWQQEGDADKAHAQVRQMQMDYADDPDKLHKSMQLDAELYMATQQYAQAIKSFTRALQRSPGDTELLYGRGIAYAESNQADAAITDLRAVLQAKPDDINAANALGFTLADADRDLPQAQKLIERALHARPDDPAITDSWGWLQYRLGNLDAAERALQKAWKAGKDPEVGGHLAEVLWRRGQQHEARRILAAARKLAPHNAVLQALQTKIAP